MNCPKCGRDDHVFAIYSGGCRVPNRYRCGACGKRFSCTSSGSCTQTLAKSSLDSPTAAEPKASNVTSTQGGNSNSKSPSAKLTKAEIALVQFILESEVEKLRGSSLFQIPVRRLEGILRKLEDMTK